MVQFVSIVFGLALALFWLFAFILLYHFIRFGVGTQPKKMAVSFVLGSVILSFIALITYIRLDLSTFS